MTDLTKSGIFVGVAVVSCVAALLTSPPPLTLEAHYSDYDLGEPFYPQFTDPLAATALEVITYDDEAGTATPFKVELQDGLWIIPSHYNYPADAKDQLAGTAAGVIDLRKDVIQSDRPQDHEILGVIDPLDDSLPTLQGRGQRVILKDESGSVLADFIIGKTDPGRSGYRYVRLPGKKRTYSVKCDVEISTNFADWIDTNLLQVTSPDIAEVEIRDYSIDETSGTADIKDTVVLNKDGSEWRMRGTPEGRELDQTKVRSMTAALSRIRITGVRPKPESLSADLKTATGITLDLGARLSLSSKGFFISNDGRLLSNEGEVSVGTEDGVRYTLRFGEVIFGEGLKITAGTEEEAREPDDEQGERDLSGPENRYLFVTAMFDESLLPPRPTAPPPPQPAENIENATDQEDRPESGADDAAMEEQGSEQPAPEIEAPEETEDAEISPDEHTTPEIESPENDAVDRDADAEYQANLKQYEQDLGQWQDDARRGQEEAEKLNARFADWYYVISGSDFGKIRLTRDKLLKDVETKDTE